MDAGDARDAGKLRGIAVGSYLEVTAPPSGKRAARPAVGEGTCNRCPIRIGFAVIGSLVAFATTASADVRYAGSPKFGQFIASRAPSAPSGDPAQGEMSLSQALRSPMFTASPA